MACLMVLSYAKMDMSRTWSNVETVIDDTTYSVITLKS